MALLELVDFMYMESRKQLSVSLRVRVMMADREPFEVQQVACGNSMDDAIGGVIGLVVGEISGQGVFTESEVIFPRRGEDMPEYRAKVKVKSPRCPVGFIMGQESSNRGYVGALIGAHIDAINILAEKCAEVSA